MPNAESCYTLNEQFSVPSESRKQVPMTGARIWNYVATIVIYFQADIMYRISNSLHPGSEKTSASDDDLSCCY